MERIGTVLRNNHFDEPNSAPLLPRIPFEPTTVYGSNIFYGVPCNYRVPPMKLDPFHQQIFDSIKPDPYPVYDGEFPNTHLGDWERINARAIASCCSEVASYTYRWDQVYNRILRQGLVSPVVYNFVYLMTKIMEQTPAIPAGTVLYRKSHTPFEDIPKGYGFMSFSTSPSGNFGKYVARYVVPEDVELKGIRFSQTAGLFEQEEYEIVVGPGVYMTNIKKEKGVGRKIDGRAIDYDYVVDLAQDIPYTWFEDNLNPELDDKYVEAVSAIVRNDLVYFKQNGVIEIIYPPSMGWVNNIKRIGMEGQHKINAENSDDLEWSGLEVLTKLYTQAVIGTIYTISEHQAPMVKTKPLRFKRSETLPVYKVDNKVMFVGDYLFFYPDKPFSLDIGTPNFIQYHGQEIEIE